MTINFVTVATNSYIRFVDPLFLSLQQHMFSEFKFFCFTNVMFPSQYEKLYIDHLPSPLPTHLRYHYYTRYWDRISHCDHIFHIDADMLAVSPISEEIASDFTVTEHPGYYLQHPSSFPLEQNVLSSAYVDPMIVQQYFIGAFQGGKISVFKQLCEINRDNIDVDFRRNYISRWCDESHLNKFASENTPSKILDPGYCIPEHRNNYHPHISSGLISPKLIALDKWNDPAFVKPQQS